MTRSVASGLLILVLVGCGRGATRPSESRPASTPAPVQEEVGPLTEAVAVRPPGPVTQIRGQAPSLAFGRDERLWVAFEEDGLVKVASSWDFGTSFTHPVTVNSEPEKVEINGENRPKIQLGDDDTVYVSWTRKLPGRFTGDVRFSRSIDGGTTFEAPRTINDDGLQIGHRFESLGVDALGHIYLAWIDKRDRGPARQRGEAYRGAAVYSAVSTDRGQNFAENQRVAPHACECCRIAMAPAPDGGVAVLWRHIF
ncbi:MAG: sialidase family protein, partial [Acidobacteriota bacterium]